MRIIVEQQLPTSLDMLRTFVEEATTLVNDDLSARVSANTDGWLTVTAVRDLTYPLGKENR